MSHADADWISRTNTAAKILDEHADHVDATGSWPKESLSALVDAKLMGLTVPTQFGGAGQGPTTLNTVLQSLAEACPSTAMIYLMHLCGTQLIVAAEDFPKRAEVLKAIADGRHLSTLAFSEKGSRSHFWAPISQAKIDGETHVLSAQKSWVTSAGHADSYIVSTRAAGLEDASALTLYFVEGSAAGLTVVGPWQGMGLRGNASAPMELTDLRLRAEHRVSPEGKGFDVMLGVVLPIFQLGNAAVNLGIARAATRATREHLLQSKFQHLGQSLADLPNLRARLARMQILVDTNASFLADVADRMERGDPDAMLGVLETKAASAEVALEVTDLAMRTCGGAAFSKHLGVERRFRDARAGWVMAPTTDVLLDFIGKSLLEMPLF